jgi:signal peptidase II
MHKAIVRVCLFLFAIDSALKSYTHQHIAPLEGSSFFYPYGGIAVFRNFFGVDFSLNYAKNTGAAWGAFGGFQKLLVCVRIAIVIGLFLYLVMKKISVARRWALSLIATGAIGNILDYFIYGHVVDVFYFVFWGYSFPVFNVADSIIFCGIVVLFLQSFLERRYPFLAKPI